MSRLARLALLAPLTLFAAFLLVVQFGPRRAQHTEAPSPLIGHPAPAFDLPGYDVTHPGLATRDLAHGTPTIVNFFASWCLPCRVEAPQLAALTARGVVVHGIAVHDSPQGLATLFRNYGNSYRRIGLDPNSRAQQAWAVQGLPETFVIDGHGIVRARHRGDLRTEDLPQILAEIARAKR